MKIKTTYIGQKFFMLTVLSSRKNPKGGRRPKLFNCQCDCGEFRETTIQKLKQERVKSCGCTKYILTRQKHKKYDPQTASYRAKVSNYKAHAKLDKREFSLSVDECISLFQNICYYCGSEPSNTYNLIKRHRVGKNNIGKYIYETKDSYEIKYNGIDRKNSKLGYTTDNCVSCCKRCNSAKSDGKYEDFINYLNNLAIYRSNLK